MFLGTTRSCFVQKHEAEVLRGTQSRQVVCVVKKAYLIKIYLAKHLKHKGNLLINETQMQA